MVEVEGADIPDAHQEKAEVQNILKDAVVSDAQQAEAEAEVQDAIEVLESQDGDAKKY